MPIRFLSIEDILWIHRLQIAMFGGSHGVRDLGLLESAVAQPQATFDSQYLCTDLFEMAASYLYHLVMDHPFIDGNKRVGAVVSAVFIQQNGYIFNAPGEEFYNLVIGVAEGAIRKPEVTAFFRQHSTPRATPPTNR